MELHIDVQLVVSVKNNYQLIDIVLSAFVGKEDGLDNKACSGMCLAGYFCPEGSTSEKQLECANFVVLENGNGNSVYCPFGSSSPLVVPAGYYSIKGNSSTRYCCIHF
jgi:hypothetical protein